MLNANLKFALPSRQFAAQNSLIIFIEEKSLMQIFIRKQQTNKQSNWLQRVEAMPYYLL